MAKKKKAKKKVGHKHQWRQMSNAKYTKVCKVCGMKMTGKKVKAGGRFGFRLELTFTDAKGKKIVIPKHHNFKTPPCPGPAKANSKATKKAA